jgi:hypothetical protein
LTFKRSCWIENTIVLPLLQLMWAGPLLKSIAISARTFLCLCCADDWGLDHQGCEVGRWIICLALIWMTVWKIAFSSSYLL